MNLHALEQTLLAAARAHPPSDAVPYAFEQRVMARLRETAPLDALSLWSRALWQAAAACVALTLVSGAMLLWQGGSDLSSEFPQDVESAMFAMADQAGDLP